ncbi:MAG: hypothetical protein ACKVJX_25175, partial [Verrucomicrobiia bacterium]
PEFSALEIRRPGAAGFRVLSLVDFKAMTDKFHPKRVPFDVRSELLLRRMDHKAYIGNSHRLRREDAEDMRTLHSILNSPTLRGAVVDSSGEPFEWPEAKLLWSVRKAEKDGSSYRAEITFENGEPVSGISFALTGTPGYYVVGCRIHEGPPFDVRRLNPGLAPPFPARPWNTRSDLSSSIASALASLKSLPGALSASNCACASSVGCAATTTSNAS